MYLKALHMRGFKSFANKTQLEFEPGTTVIVGPNGSGKSNIVEAFLWVTGEQNPRSLRSTKMEDVIFGGSAVKPAAGNAEVTLCFDNSQRVFPIDYSEVTISRRVFRSGDSEYIINGAPCRLADVQELLLNTGVGKEMYSVVGQGRLDDILNSRTEERRYLIEEAAGLGRYKRRKEKALRKLGSTERNLLRVKDILSEIKRQLKPLQDQARVANQHKRLVNNLRELEIKYILADIAGLESKRDEYEKQGKKASKEIKGVGSAVLSMKEELQGFETKLEECRVRLEKLKDDMQVVLTCRERVRGLHDLLKEKRTNLERQSERLVDEVTEFESEIADLDKTIKGLTQDLKKREEQARTLGDKVLECEKGLGQEQTIAKLTEQIAQVRAGIKSEEKLEQMLTGVALPKNVKGFLADLIDVSDEYAKEIEESIGKKLMYMLIKDIKTGKSTVQVELMAEERNQKIAFVTGKGHVVSSLDIKGAKSGQDLLMGRKRRLAAFREEEKELSSKIALLEKESKQRKRESEHLRKEMEELTLSITEAKVDLRSGEDRREHLNEQIKRVRESSKNITNSSDKAGFESKLENISALEALLERLATTINKTMADTNSLVELERITETQYRQDIGDRRSKLAELEKNLAVFERESHLEDISKAQLEPKIKTLTEQLKGDFELSLDKARKKFKPDKPADDLVIDMRELRNRIEYLGPVNPIAAEEYEEVELRRQHLEDQINDLKKSERSLHKVIGMMDKTMAEKFRDVFEETNNAFKELFQYMFPEGKAELKLTDPENILITGIEIEAQPSGKRFKKLSLLSGGESAMTAIALIFAMFKINPAPFYILDECDVALDDINLQRLVSLVDMFREQAQFLIVTHQRRTMEMAEILYGVSMQKDGVSRLVSQRLKEAEGDNARAARTVA